MRITFEEPTLSAAEELALAEAIEAGVLARATRGVHDPRGRPSAVSEASEAELLAVERAGEAAWSQFLSANFRLVTLVTTRLALRANLDPDDLFQEGVLGMMEALRRFDHRRGARFATFALPWIRMRVHEASVTRCGDLGIPPSRAKKWVRVMLTREALASEMGRRPTDAEIALVLGRTEASVRSLLAFAPPASLDFDQHLLESVELPIATAPVDVVGVRRLMRCLTRDERDVIERLYGFGMHSAMTCQEAASDLGVSASTIRRRERSALGRLRGCEEVLDVA
jgi:RNA polymerase primary sigma factor